MKISMLKKRLKLATSDVTMDVTSIQASYTVAGMTFQFLTKNMIIMTTQLVTS